MTKSILTASLGLALLLQGVLPATANTASGAKPVLITVKSDRGGGVHSPIAQAILDQMAKE